MKSVVLFAVAMAVPGVVQAQDRQRFDLVCTGVRTSQPVLARDRARVEPIVSSSEIRYRIDLSRSAWCEHSCTTTRNIASATPTVLTLSDDPNDIVEISRTNGALRSRKAAGVVEQINVGVCLPSDFTGIPASVF